jgi:hypothetical protein
MRSKFFFEPSIRAAERYQSTQHNAHWHTRPVQNAVLGNGLKIGMHAFPMDPNFFAIIS